MGIDHDWVAVDQVVRAALEDKAVLTRPPTTEEDWMWLAATITDHIVAAFVTTPRGRAST